MESTWQGSSSTYALKRADVSESMQVVTCSPCAVTQGVSDTPLASMFICCILIGLWWLC